MKDEQNNKPRLLAFEVTRRCRFNCRHCRADADSAVRRDELSTQQWKRILDAVAAYERYGGPGIVVDFGTATTFDAISRQGEYLGGGIAPGIEISSQALFRAAARLTREDIEDDALPQPHRRRQRALAVRDAGVAAGGDPQHGLTRGQAGRIHHAPDAAVVSNGSVERHAAAVVGRGHARWETSR